MSTGRKDKHGYTIGIKHYLNKRLKGKENSVNPETNEVEYPVYIQITVKKQTLRVRSALYAFCTPESFVTFCQERAQDIKNEVAIIRRYVISQKPFEDPSFKLEWSWQEAAFNFTLDGIVSSFLIDITFGTIQAKTDEWMIRNERLWQRAKTDRLPCRALTDKEYKESLAAYERESAEGYDELSLVAKMGIAFDTSAANFHSMLFSLFIPEVKALRDEFPPEFWDLTNYLDKITSVHKVQFFTVDDLINGRFDTLFMETWGNDKSLESIRAGFEHLREVYPYFDELVEECVIESDTMK